MSALPKEPLEDLLARYLEAQLAGGRRGALRVVVDEGLGADFLDLGGFDVLYLGANVPTDGRFPSLPLLVGGHALRGEPNLGRECGGKTCEREAGASSATEFIDVAVASR